MIQNKEKYEFLRQLPIFADAGQEVLMAMASSLTEKDVMKGSTIIRKGEEGDAVFIIASGRVRVHDGNHVLARLEAGQVFGEYALIDQRTRSASVTADESCVLLRLDYRDFYRHAAGNPSILQGVLKQLINRMRDMNELEEKLSKSYLKIQRQKELIEKQNESISLQKVQLEQQNYDLTKLNEEKNHLISTLIHQIKNPLTSSLCMAEMLDAREGHVDETEKEGLAIIRNSIKRINNLINEILDVSTIDSKVYELKMEPLNVRTILEELIENYRYFIEQKNVLFKSDLTDISAKLNRVYVTQIFDNLLSNAIKFTPEGSSVEIGLSKKDDTVIFTVMDEGPGIPEEKIHQVFDQYNRQTSMFDQELAQDGLGLAIVYKYTTAMKGKVKCESEIGKGTRFIVELPA
ncbi:MAG: cyclic nucleotide-binding domain-containing protein [Bacteroidales bacterium]|nr:cyclic nucleotide-binding domain-containing protein [Bacteroidales bacterium]